MGRPDHNPRSFAHAAMRAGNRGASASELRERVKELGCLYDVARTCVEHRRSLRDCFRRIAAILPGAWRFPELAEACVQLDNIDERTPGFERVVHVLTTDINAGGRRRGAVSVGYTAAEVSPASEGAFLAEERALLDAVANQIGVYVDSVEAEERRASMESQLRHADRLATIGQLAAGVAHELNEPLGNVLGFAQLALKAPNVPDEVRSDLDKIVEASLHGRAVIRKLLLFARQAPAAKQPVDLNTIVEDGMFLLEAGCEHPAVRFVRELTPGLPEIEADPVQVRQVLMNLVMNAVHAIPESGAITVRTGREGSFLTLGVDDTGEGMPPEIARQVFDPFFTTKDVGKGTGLGLSVVQGIVASHGGSIHLDTSPGEGARFLVRFPLSLPSSSGGNEEAR